MSVHPTISLVVQLKGKIRFHSSNSNSSKEEEKDEEETSLKSKALAKKADKTLACLMTSIALRTQAQISKAEGNKKTARQDLVKAFESFEEGGDDDGEDVWEDCDDDEEDEEVEEEEEEEEEADGGLCMPVHMRTSILVEMARLVAKAPSAEQEQEEEDEDDGDDDEDDEEEEGLDEEGNPVPKMDGKQKRLLRAIAFCDEAISLDRYYGPSYETRSYLKQTLYAHKKELREMNAFQKKWGRGGEDIGRDDEEEDGDEEVDEEEEVGGSGGGCTPLAMVHKSVAARPVEEAGEEEGEVEPFIFPNYRYADVC
jgi:tetratricopeptide (TPR) repeat protein